MNKPNTNGILFGIIAILVLIIIILLFWKKPFTAAPAPVVVPQEQVATAPLPDEDAASFTNQAADVKSLKKLSNGNYELVVDTLTNNPKFVADGSSSEPFLLNNNPKLRTITITASTFVHGCDPDTKSTLEEILLIPGTKQLNQIFFTSEGDIVSKVGPICVP